MDRTPVVFIHGADLHALSWDAWAERFARHGYPTRTARWPGEAATARRARERPDGVPDTGLDELTEHHAEVVRSLARPPVLVGHAVGGLVAQHLLGAGLGRAAVALAPVNRVPLPATGPVGTPAPLSRAGFREFLANAVSAEEAERLYERFAVPAPRRLLADLADLDGDGAPRSPSALVDTANARRGPLLLVSGQEDRLVPDSVTRAVYRLYGDCTALTDLKQFADRGHSLVVDSGWRAVADHVLGWLAARGVRPTGAHH
ncbi:alpha/beta hydrolase [Kitasatospora sp. NPDC127059]|uniref:alpha/beta hydrolase n=1 Tax=unclassified Kitasatospora TaxID=2633591 RepID=UPI0036474372